MDMAMAQLRAPTPCGGMSIRSRSKAIWCMDSSSSKGRTRTFSRALNLSKLSKPKSAGIPLVREEKDGDVKVLHFLVDEPHGDSETPQPRDDHAAAKEEEKVDTTSSSSSSSSSSYSYLRDGKLDKFHRLRTPRAARELSLCVLYAGFVSQVHPLKVLEDRIQASKEQIGRQVLETYDHAPRNGQPIYVKNESIAKELEAMQEQEATIDTTVLTANPYVIYNKFVLSLAQKIIKATSSRWDEQEPVIKDLIPSAWKDECNGRLLEMTIMHMAVAEIEVLGASPNIVINEAVELAKRFCDGFAPRVVNGCLGSYFRSRQARSKMSPIAKDVQTSLSSSLYESIGWNDEYLD